MIIFGTKGINSTIDKGVFYCPNCEAETDYRLRKVTRFFTLYFIPLIPLGKLGEFAECKNCKSTFVPQVIDYNPGVSKDKFLAEYEKAMKHALVLMMLADGEIDENELLEVQAIINRLGHNDITISELEFYAQAVQNSPDDITTYLSRISSSLNDHSKEMVLKSAVSVAAADGHIDETEYKLLLDMGKVMSMTTAHTKGVITEAEDEIIRLSNEE